MRWFTKLAVMLVLFVSTANLMALPSRPPVVNPPEPRQKVEIDDNTQIFVDDKRVTVDELLGIPSDTIIIDAVDLNADKTKIQLLRAHKKK